MDLSSHGVTDEIQLGCHSDNIGKFLDMQINAAIIEKYVLFDQYCRKYARQCHNNYVYANVFMVNDYDRHH
jgi:hypothetical protein